MFSLKESSKQPNKIVEGYFCQSVHSFSSREIILCILSGDTRIVFGKKYEISLNAMSVHEVHYIPADQTWQQQAARFQCGV